MAGLKTAAHQPVNLSKDYDVKQDQDESPAAFLEQLQEAFRRYTPYDPESQENAAALTLAFISQAAPDIRRKLQKLECLGEKSIKDLVTLTEKVYNGRESVEVKEIKKEKHQNQHLAGVLLAATDDPDIERDYGD